MKPPPSDLKILETIYDQYYAEFASFGGEGGERTTKIFVPIDITHVARELGVDADIVFGRLHYHLDKKYGYRRDAGSRVAFFELKIGEDRYCVNFPLMASVLAGLKDEDRKYSAAMLIALGSLLVSIVSLTVSTVS